MSAVKHFTENLAGKDYVVGDIHGCFDLLTDSLREVGFNSTVDRLFSVGDLVDRGPKSEESLEWLAEPWFHAVRGNHEQMAIDYMAFGDNGYYAYNGGQRMLDLPKTHAQLFADEFAKLPIAIDIKVDNKLYGIIHADCPTKSWLEMEDALNGKNKDGYENVAMWSRDRFNYKDTALVDDVELVYVGHTPLKNVLSLGNVLYIDTGACFKGALTILEIY